MAHYVVQAGHKPKVHASVFAAETAVLIGDVEVQEGASIWYNAVLRGDENHISVGKYTNIQDNVTVHSDLDQPLEIGDYVLIGHNALIHCVKIGTGCLIGMGAVLMSYAEIGENSIIGAGTLITERKKIPPNSLVYGNPARIIRTLREEEIADVRNQVMAYHQLAQTYSKDKTE